MSIDEAGPNDDTLNPYYHSTGDTIDKLNFTKTVEFVKVGVFPTSNLQLRVAHLV